MTGRRVACALLAAALTASCRQATTEPPKPLSAYERGIAQALTVGPPPGALGYPVEPPDDAAAVYGSRAGFFSWVPKTHRPDADWRRALSDRLANAEPLWSQGYEELVIRDYFKDRRGGVFVDVGCYRPMFESTTYYLERNLGWTGIGIDGMPGLAEGWATHRPSATFLTHAVSDTNDDEVTFYVGKLTSALDEAIVKQFGGTKEEIKLATRTLDTILDAHGIEKVDFLSMDIEGAEPLALAGFDIERYRPDLCCIEATKRDEIRAYFAAHGYELIKKYEKVDRINDYFRPVTDAGSD